MSAETVGSRVASTPQTPYQQYLNAMSVLEEVTRSADSRPPSGLASKLESNPVTPVGKKPAPIRLPRSLGSDGGMSPSLMSTPSITSPRSALSAVDQVDEASPSP